MERSTYNVNISWDDEADVWVALSDDIPLALESNSYDALIERVKVAAPEIIELNSKAHVPASFLIKSERLPYSPISNRNFPVDGKIKSRHIANAIMNQQLQAELEGTVGVTGV